MIISALLKQLNLAAEFLAEAQMFYREGNFQNAFQSANQSIQEVNNLIEEAERLKNQAVDDYENRLLWTTTVSTIEICAIVLGSVISWRIFKRHYSKRNSNRSYCESIG